MFDWMMRTDGSRAAYILRMVGLSLSGAFIVLAVLGNYFPDAKGPEFEPDPAQILFGTIVISPIVETLLMWGIITGLRRFIDDPRMIIFVSAGIWAGFHSMGALIWGPVIFWPFLMFSITFVNWQQRSEKDALIMTMLVHALHNSVPAIMMVSAIKSGAV